MPVLENARHEKFCQELAKGKTGDEAYQLAGYKENRANAARLKSNELISARIAELLGRSAVRAEVSVATITERLIRISDAGEALKEAAGLSVARQAAMDAAKLHGLIVDKKETGKPGEFTRMDENELDDFIAREKVALGGGDSREESAHSQTGVRKPSGLH